MHVKHAADQQPRLAAISTESECAWLKISEKLQLHVCPLHVCFSADVLGRSVDEPLESGGVGEERPGELPHPATADHQEDQRGERSKVKGQREDMIHCVCPSHHVCVRVCVQVQEQCQYELVTPLAIMFSSTLLQVRMASIVQVS